MAISKQIHGGCRAHWGNRSFSKHGSAPVTQKKILSFVLPENVSNEQRTGGLGGSQHQVPLTTQMKKALQTTEVFCSGPAHTNRLRMQRQNCFHAYSSSLSQACRRWQPSNTSRVTSGYSEHVKRGTKTTVWGSGA